MDTMHILALDSEPLALESLAWELTVVFPQAGIRQETKSSSAISWATALAEQGQTLSFAFLEIQLDEMNGLEVAKQLKILHPQVSVIFCTAYTEYALDAFRLYAKGYLLKPVLATDVERVLDEMVKDWRKPDDSLTKNVRIQTFGNFCVYVNDCMLTFEREKAKELMAYLVDRHGSPVTTEQIAIVLWEDVYDRKLKNKTTAVISSLRSTLRSAGIESVLVKSWNHLALDISKVMCDAYDFEKGDLFAINSFRGEYMANYSWAEVTTGYYVRLNERRNKETEFF